MTDICLAKHESKILTFAKNDSVERRYRIRAISYFINSSNSGVDTIDIDDIGHISPYDSDERVYIPFASKTINKMHLLVAFLVRNNVAAANISRLEISFLLRAGGTNTPEENFVFNVTFVQDLNLISCPSSTPPLPVPTTADVSTSPIPVPTATADVSTTIDVSTPSTPILTTANLYTSPTPTPTTADATMNCSEIINEIRTVGSAVEEVCETSPIDQGSTVFGILLPLVVFIGLLQVAALVVMVHLWCRVSNSNLDRRIKEQVEHIIANDYEKTSPASAVRRNNQSGPMHGSKDIRTMPMLASLMQSRGEDTSAYNSNSVSGSSLYQV